MRVMTEFNHSQRLLLQVAAEWFMSRDWFKNDQVFAQVHFSEYVNVKFYTTGEKKEKTLSIFGICRLMIFHGELRRAVQFKPKSLEKTLF